MLYNLLFWLLDGGGWIIKLSQDSGVGRSPHDVGCSKLLTFYHDDLSALVTVMAAHFYSAIYNYKHKHSVCS